MRLTSYKRSLIETEGGKDDVRFGRIEMVNFFKYYFLFLNVATSRNESLVILSSLLFVVLRISCSNLLRTVRSHASRATRRTDYR
jgi:hypothetical protein